MPQAHLNSNSDDLNIRLDHKHFTSPLNQASITLEPNAVAALKSIRGGSCEGREFTGWFDWPNRRGFKIAEEIMSWKATYREDFDLVVVIGIGGSYLGTKALADISAHTFAPGFIKDHQTSTPQLVFAGQNMSESALGDLLDLMETRSPILNIISKSGTTTEPGVAFRVLRSWLENRYGKAIAATRIIATTDLKNGALRRLADSNHYRTFEVPDDVGGRYSVLTAVGLVPLALCGFNILEMLEGAHRVFRPAPLV
ncbi:MAG: hypothetical protein NTV34_21665 [Proteobacteria bacterium]|nr:hypothetical protein [Pseudomonadota bacterium]